MIRASRLAVCLCVAWLAAGAQAQVTRCTDARTGKVTYTDGTCITGEAAREVEPRRTAQEIILDRQLSAEALDRKQQRQQAESEAADAEARRIADRNRARAAQTAPQAQDYARSPECARSRRNYEMLAGEGPRGTQEHEQRLTASQRQMDLDCLGPQGYADVERARAAHPQVVIVPPRYGVGYPAPYPPAVFPQPYPQQPQQPQPRLTQCSDFRCTDNQGTSYPRTGPGRFPGQGGVCKSNGGGGQAPC